MAAVLQVGKMYSNVPRYFYIRASLVHSNNNKENCIIEHIGRLQNLSHAHYQQNFSITCNNGNSSVGIQCFTSENDDTSQILSVQGNVHKYICMYIRIYVLHIHMYMYVHHHAHIYTVRFIYI